ncbi:STAS/SEC14 domain-containing protein [Formosa sp. S-31]|uniref:STAS/SEC14 domain-containing protein n=1 Tax=Formosa sp. S-31 TaxID=2790949 RepID=UPI003EBC4ADE
MLEQLKTFSDNSLAIEVIDGFSETDESLCQKWFNEKTDQGHSHVNMLIKLDEIKLSKSSTKAFFEDTVFTLRHLKSMGNLAIVGHSNILKALVPIDNFFFTRMSNGFEERYFDKSQLNKALQFITESN